MQDSNPEQPMKSTLKNERNLRYIYSWTNAILLHCYTRATWTMHQRPNSLHQLLTLLIYRQAHEMNNLGCSVTTKAYIQMKHMVLAQYGMYVTMSEYKSIFESCTFITKKDGSHWHLKYIQIQKHYVHKNCGQVKKSTTTAAKRKQFTRALWTRPLPHSCCLSNLYFISDEWSSYLDITLQITSSKAATATTMTSAKTKLARRRKRLVQQQLRNTRNLPWWTY